MVKIQEPSFFLEIISEIESLVQTIEFASMIMCSKQQQKLCEGFTRKS